MVSVKQLARYINLSYNNQSIMAVIRDIYKSRISKMKNITQAQKNDQLDNAIEAGFHLYRHWFQFTVPKAFRVVDSLQRYVCVQNGKKPGSYSYFVQQLENDFVGENLSILIEYGIPSNTVRQIANKIPSDLNEDDIVEFIRENRQIIYTGLLQYEIDRLEQVL